MIMRACGLVAAIVIQMGAVSAWAGEAPGRITAGPVQAQRWSIERANEWYVQHGWLVGCNFAPSTAINQLEMWQATTFDPATIDRELGWAQDLGFNSLRVFLHNLLWTQDAEGFTKRMEQFLEIADRHKIGVMFVLFDGVWDPFPHIGRQREPRPHVHNSGWVQSPGVQVLRDSTRHDKLREYVRGVIGHFRQDRRVHVWDLFNEPDNINRPAYVKFEAENKADLALALLKKTVVWAREVDPCQPITAGVWAGDWSSDEKLSPINRYMLDNSDIITFHCYSSLPEMQQRVESLRRFGRPILCTEYMARPAGSTFEAILPHLEQENVGAYNWGLVAGRTQTIYPWDSWQTKYKAEPPVWFHDIFRKDGKPFDPNEVERIKKTIKGE
ncbi:MAG: cellulase family glycosylhydrolase [Sedimentisphaerales bacterium]|nr:cellulase family glycosylhydrolase [Sedimentisphaerales bacterium]